MILPNQPSKCCFYQLLVWCYCLIICYITRRNVAKMLNFFSRYVNNYFAKTWRPKVIVDIYHKKVHFLNIEIFIESLKVFLRNTHAFMLKKIKSNKNKTKRNTHLKWWSHLMTISNKNVHIVVGSLMRLISFFFLSSLFFYISRANLWWSMSMFHKLKFRKKAKQKKQTNQINKKLVQIGPNRLNIWNEYIIHKICIICIRRESKDGNW